MRRLVWVLLGCASACAAPSLPGSAATVVRGAGTASTGSMTISVIGTNDLHGHMSLAAGKGGLALLGGYLANVRAARARDGGAVVLVDAGDAMQGTLESNLDEGAAVIRAYGVLHYDALAIGNHEFDFGPVGPAMVPQNPGDDPRGALAQRSSEARFPFLDANTIDEATGKPLALPGSKPSRIVEVGGVKVGIIGVTTIDTPTTTTRTNLAGLRFDPLAPVIEAETTRLRADGARVIIVAAHAGAVCKSVDNPDDLSSCDDGEILKLARALPAGGIDAIVGGHTHNQIAHRVNGIPVVESFASGAYFSRIDLTVRRGDGTVTAAHIFPPQPVVPGNYEGAPVVADARVEEAIAPAVTAARSQRDQKLGVRITSPVLGAYSEESALGDLFADLVHAARPAADIAIVNSGALHADWPAGDLTYGAVFESYPFDNRFATVRLTGAGLASLIEHNLHRSSGILLVAGAHAVVDCQGGKVTVHLIRDNGRPIGDDEPITMVTSDFLAGGGDDFGLARLNLAPSAVALEEGSILREAAIDILKKRGGDLSGDDRKIFDPQHRRIAYPGKRPVSCPGDPADRSK